MRIEDPRLGPQAFADDLMHRLKKLCKPGEAAADVLHRMWYDEGVPLQSIAQTLGCSLGRLRYLSAYCGVAEPSTLPHKQLVAKVSELAEIGYLASDIAKELGLKTATVQSIAEKYDVEILED